MNLDRYTQKAQEAILAAQRLASEADSPVLDAEHLLAALLDDDRGHPAMTLRRLGADVPRLRMELAAALSPAGRVAAAQLSPGSGAPSSSCSGPRTRHAGSRTSTSPRSTCCSRPREAGGDAQRLLEAAGAGQEALLGALPGGARRPARDVPEPGVHVPGARAATAAT